MTSIKRICKEIREFNDYIDNNPVNDHRILYLDIDEDNIFNIQIYFLGPEESFYEELIHIICIKFDNTYPMNPPKINFINNIFHPNISANGSICLDILDKNWKPIYTLSTILISLISLLSDPNPDSALNLEASKLYKLSKNSSKSKIEYIKNIIRYNNSS